MIRFVKHFLQQLETLLIHEMQRRSDYLDLGLRFNYWRDKDGHEVDVIISRNSDAEVWQPRGLRARHVQRQ